MAYFKVNRLAANTSLTAGELEDMLFGARQVVVEYPNGTIGYLHGGEAEIWYAGNNDELALKVFASSTEEHVEDEFVKFQLLRNNQYVAKAYCTGVLVDDYGVPHPALVEEHVRGKTLYNLFTHDSAHNPEAPLLDAKTTIAIALELSRALASIADAGIAHRDISPANVLIRNWQPTHPLPQQLELVLIDFGSAAYIQGPEISIRFNHPRLATVPYAAPEVFGGEHAEETILVGDSLRKVRNSPLADVWSLGAVVTYLMSGEYWPPEIWDIREHGLGATGNFAEEMECVVNAKRVPIDLASLLSRQRDLTKWDWELCDLVRQCTDFDPHSRPDLLDALETLQTLAGDYQREQESGHATIPQNTPSMPDFLVGVMRNAGISLDGYDQSAIVTDAAGCRFAIQDDVLVRCLKAADHMRIPDGVHVIGEEAFRGNSVVRTIDLPVAVTLIERDAFKGANQLRHVVMAGVEYIGAHAFAGCTSLRNMDAPRAKSLGEMAFARCSALETISLPSLEHVEPYAFINCTALEEAFLGPRGRVGYWMFGDCHSLQTVHLGGITALDDYGFINCEALRVFSAPDVRDVGRSAFLNCHALREVSLPSAVSIGSHAFAWCNNLVMADAPNASRIGERAFCGCSSAVRIRLGSATSVGEGSFEGCTSLVGPGRSGNGQSSDFWSTGARTT